MNDALLENREGAIVTLTIDREATRNALSPDVVEALEDACGRLNADLSVGCVILTGAGSAFSSGGNLKEMHMREGMFGGRSAEKRRGYIHGIHRIPRAIYNLEPPIIAAVNGPAIGAGLDLALMCDIRIASNNASFAENFVRVGLVSGDGGAWFLPRIIGPSRAMEMTLRGHSVDAQCALEWNIVSQVTQPQDLLGAARRIATEIASHPLHSVRLSKRLLREAQRLDLSAALELAAAMQGIVQHTSDQREAVSAVLERRPPVFVGR
jgi:enoyl-CoA hydratase/carnithine racemase